MNELLSDTRHRSRTVTADQLLTALFEAAHTVESRIEEALDTVGLSWAKLDLLTKLAQARETLPLSELAARMTCVRSNITQLVDRLEADKLVHRENDPQDRRTIRAALTLLGRERQVAGEKLIDEVQEEVVRALSTVDQETLERVLHALRVLAMRK